MGPITWAEPILGDAAAFLTGVADRPTKMTVIGPYGYARNIAEKRHTPVYEQAVALLASTTADALSLGYEQPRHDPDLLTHAGETRPCGAMEQTARTLRAECS